MSPAVDPRAACIIGVARQTWHPADAPDGAPEPLAMWEEMARAAAADAGVPGALAALESIDVVFTQSWQYDDPPARLARTVGRHVGPAELFGPRGLGPPGAGLRHGRPDDGRPPRPRPDRRRRGAGHRPPAQEGRREAAVVVQAGRAPALPHGPAVPPLRDQPRRLRGLPDLRHVRQRTAGAPADEGWTSIERSWVACWLR